MAENNRTIIGIFIALLVIVIAAVIWWLRPGDGGEPAETVTAATPAPAPTPTPSLEERLSARLAGTTLSTSDAVVRELAANLSANPKLAAWLVNEDLVRRYVNSVDNIASGVSPRKQLEFLRPNEGFKVNVKGGDVIVVEPSSYPRAQAAHRRSLWRDRPSRPKLRQPPRRGLRSAAGGAGVDTTGSSQSAGRDIRLG